MEVVKTRLQLDGEVGVGGGARARQFRGVADALARTAHAEGLRGLQAGLSAAILYQIIMNGTRLGLYTPLQEALSDALGLRGGATGEQPVPWGVKAVSAAASGAVGATLGSPLFLIKARMQAQSPIFQTAETHAPLRGLAHGLRSVWAAEGARGLLRGVEGAIPRVCVGSAVQLVSFDLCRAAVAEEPLCGSGGGDGDDYSDGPPACAPPWLVSHDAVRPTSRSASHLCRQPEGGAASSLGHTLRHVFVPALLSSLLTVTAMNPLDVVSSRLYNSAGRGTVYAGPLDCLRRTLHAEGPRALLKGWGAQYLRLGPHTILTFLLLDRLKREAEGVGALCEVEPRDSLRG